ncbi:hypothetical protein H6G20_19665 [Desertifilum sp. FACHB-1129]|uniref:Uncharacterized protein n=2 Tax=Desertifilum tharense IPPAS B-1220 TaxID=1781255 RepID=A0A1E5QDT1_9CYAN|nr:MULTISPECIES: hypothetical protein [Desertifilum]MDA0210472.1 hypothetical protein [Cyanobacteria bacterium FC1]MBD2313890.1 hypothetical protein [Desertifilum sp. FACHB-1129]MBD2324721.1 hypothetical protein [Desertifilum sp. FACHB-866]MBD2334885.1 hypothetical protein [Desertifilum sp. FACHB-868]OEJ72483.1 hypothetical protein BH720_24735 [Desertifilum tharense IPPAS B-1220]
MKYSADIAVYSKKNELKLLVEVKIQRGTSPEWAAKFLRNRSSIHEALPKVCFFLMALPDAFYLWKNPVATEIILDSNLPNYHIDPESFLKPYFRGLASLKSQEAFSLVVLTWLNHLINDGEDEVSQNIGQEWLVESGLLKAIQGGRIEDQMLV